MSITLLQVPKKFSIECCDCGLVHDVVLNSQLEVTFEKNLKKTKEMREERFKFIFIKEKSGRIVAHFGETEKSTTTVRKKSLGI